MRRYAAIVCAALAGLAAGPALAQPVAHIKGGTVAVRSGPGPAYPVIGRLADGTAVTLDRCTRNERWCFVTGAGWVEASWIVGWSAKIRATPPHFPGPGW